MKALQIQCGFDDVQPQVMDREAMVDWMMNGAENEMGTPDYIELASIWGCSLDVATRLCNAFYDSGILTELDLGKKQERCEALVDGIIH